MTLPPSALSTTKQIALLTTMESVFCPNSSLEAGDLNYTSFSVVMKSGSNSRTDAMYQVSVKNPHGITKSMELQTIKFGKLPDTTSYIVKFESTLTSSGYIIWRDNVEMYRRRVTDCAKPSCSKH
ncbi:hypothetical protein SUGI_0573600 [Cryptomeria japonica]|nr:hypothetical protein SUGI_0573600 [Cryptomeria japonica]